MFSAIFSSKFTPWFIGLCLHSILSNQLQILVNFVNVTTVLGDKVFLMCVDSEEKFGGIMYTNLHKLGLDHSTLHCCFLFLALL